jgi:hypothetical protein
MVYFTAEIAESAEKHFEPSGIIGGLGVPGGDHAAR